MGRPGEENVAFSRRELRQLHVGGQSPKRRVITPPVLLGSLLLEGDPYFLGRANDLRTRRPGMPVADLALFVVCGKAGDESDELIDDWRIFAGNLLGELVPLGDDFSPPERGARPPRLQARNHGTGLDDPRPRPPSLAAPRRRVTPPRGFLPPERLARCRPPATRSACLPLFSGLCRLRLPPVAIATHAQPPGMRGHRLIDALATCDTAEVEGYLVEGHVPAVVVERLLRERPKAKGVGVPGMPLGSPGMENPLHEAYGVILFGDDGQSVFARCRGPEEIS